MGYYQLPDQPLFMNFYFLFKRDRLRWNNQAQACERKEKVR